MQILCGLQVVFFLFNCQTPDLVIPERLINILTCQYHVISPFLSILSDANRNL